MKSIQSLLEQNDFTRSDIIELLSKKDEQSVEQIRSKAETVLLETRGEYVFYRGLIEFSNVCSSDCLYCGIRKSNNNVKRYTIDPDRILASAQWCADQGYGSVVLQSGERTDNTFIDLVEQAVRKIKEQTRSEKLPEGLGITLCIGEQSEDTYKRLYDAGAHRYLLRIETTSPELFSSIHPPKQTLIGRLKCLSTLKNIGYQVGTGVMIGLPNQTVDNLADDILFFKKMDIDMIGMGPYIVHPQTPMSHYTEEIKSRSNEIYQLALKMIAVCRIVLKDVNIAATTALQAMQPEGREDGLRFGANVIMPQLTPLDFRKDYLLYEGKPCLDEDEVKCRNCLAARISSVGRKIGYNDWGDSLHYSKRKSQ